MTPMETMPVVAMNDMGQIVDQFGNDVTHQIPYHKKLQLRQEGGCLKLINTTTGGTQWRHQDIQLFEELVNNTVPLADVDNGATETQESVQTFISSSPSLRPDNLLLSDLKWKYLMRSVVRGKNIMMTGPSGTGKTLAVQMVAKALNGRPFFYFNLGATQDPRSTLIGNTHFSKEKGTYVADSLFVQAVQTPNAIVLLDELTRANPDAWNILMTPLDENQRYLRIDEKPDTPTIKVAKGVTFIATANIGAEYTSTRVLDRAILDRFSAIVEMDYLSLEEEEKLLRMTYPALATNAVKAIAEIASVTRAQLKSDDPKVSTAISSRMTVEMAGNIFDGFTLAEAAEVCIFPLYSEAGGVDSERTFMRQLIQKYIPVESTSSTNPWEAANNNTDSSL